jgi:pilus assembly protein CpaB
VTARRRRGLLLLSLALASGGLAASQVAQRQRQVEERVGPLVPVLVAARDLAPGARLTKGALAVRRVPARFVPPDAIGSAAEVIGARTALPLGPGSYLTAGQLESASGSGPGAAGPQIGPGERTVEVGVSGGGMLAAHAPGTRVDVVVSTEPGGGGGAGRTFVALADVRLLALRGDPAGGAYGAAGDEAAPDPAALATLLVTLRQAVYLTAADNFGREIRLLARPPGDRTRTTAAAVSAGDL